MQLADLLLLAALIAACVALGLVVHPSFALALFAVGATALWYFLGDAE